MRKCLACGAEITGAKTKKYCDAKCRKRGQLGIRVIPTAAPVDGLGPVESVTFAELAAVERLETVAGASAVALARSIDSGGVTGSAMAALVKELRATMVDATADVRVAADPLDELRQRRQLRREGA